MVERTWTIGICGTFDVANYGDLLFPLIAKAELTERLGAVRLRLFSYHAKAPPDWPLHVESLTTLPEAIRHLDALLIGGGHVIRFDKQIAPGYAPPTSEIHHPTGYWLTPALLALQHDVPLLWNAPGVHGDIPAWAQPLMKMVLAQSRYLSVRDTESRIALEPFANGTPIAVVPDTAFRLPGLNLGGPPSAEFASLCAASGIQNPYIVLQATPELQGFVRFLMNHRERFQDFKFLALPVSPVVGEGNALIDTGLPGVIGLPDWPGPLLLAELIGRSQAAVGYSYHLFITALASGVPIFTHQDMSLGKYSGLQRFETIFKLPAEGEADPDWFLDRVGRTAPSASVLATRRPLAEHWDRLAAALQADTLPTSPVLNRFWQSLPEVLEAAELTLADSLAALKQEREESHLRFAGLERTHRETELHLRDALAELDATRRQASARQDWMETQLAAARAERTERDQQLAEILASRSWRLTAPLRSAASLFSKPAKRPLIRLERIRRHRLETEPYKWAAIPELFDPPDGANLAVSYPCDQFKLVASHDGEKEYRYEARALIGMGENTIAYPEELNRVWRALAADLLSPEYREAMAALTGCDLAQAPMEVNLFHYPPGGSLGAHKDLPDKIVTHVLYFNRSWNSADGGCLGILRSADAADQVAEILPIVGNSSVIVRSDNSWHAVSRVVNHSAASRRSITVTFYRPGSVSTMWPPGDTTPLHRYQL